MDSAVVILSLLLSLLYAPFRHEELRIEGSEFDTVTLCRYGCVSAARTYRYFNLP